MMDPIREKIGRWSIDRVKFMLSHLEDFVTESKSLSKEMVTSMIGFSGQTGLKGVTSFSCSLVDRAHLPTEVLQHLIPFFESGMLLQRASANDESQWWVTDLFYRGQAFKLELRDQLRADHLLTEISPLQIVRAPPKKILSTIGLDFLNPPTAAMGFLIRPTPTTAYVLISTLADLWLEEHMIETQRLINNAFLE